MIIAALATLETVIATVVLVVVEYIRSRAPDAYPLTRTMAKLSASTGFLVVGLHGLGGHADRDHASFAGAVCIGLALGAVGDIALLGRSTRAFMGGLVAFLLGHLAYCVGIAVLVRPQYWLAAAGWLGVLPVIAAFTVYDRYASKFGKLRPAVAVYCLVITAMVVGALAVYRGGLLDDAHAAMFALGALLFFGSDIAVARERFVAHDFRNKLLGLPAYFAGQLLIAWTIALV